MKGDIKVPKTILEDIINETILKLKENSEFDENSINELESLLKNIDIDPKDIINVLKGDN